MKAYPFTQVNSHAPRAFKPDDPEYTRWLEAQIDFLKSDIDSRSILWDLQANDVATSTNTTETTLYSATIPANTLGAVASILRLNGCGVFGANTNGKTIRAYLGATKIFDSGTQTGNGIAWAIDSKISIIASNSQRVISCGLLNGVLPIIFYSALAVDLTTDQILKITGQNASAFSDITLKYTSLEISKLLV